MGVVGVVVVVEGGVVCVEVVWLLGVTLVVLVVLLVLASSVWLLVLRVEAVGVVGVVVVVGGDMVVVGVILFAEATMASQSMSIVVGVTGVGGLGIGLLRG